MSLSFRIARNAPVGVVIANYSRKLSRIYRWDLATDDFVPGQFLKDAAFVEDISPDGKYVAYYRSHAASIDVSHVPYFAALAYFLTHPQLKCGAEFSGDGSLRVETHHPDDPRVQGSAFVHPGCPFAIVREPLDQSVEMADNSFDAARSRTIVADHELNQLFAIPAGHKRRVLLATFPREPFQEIAPPDWVTRW